MNGSVLWSREDHVKRLLTFGSSLFAALAILSGSADAANELSLTILDNGVPVVGAEVTVYLSYGAEKGFTDENGVVTFEIENGKGFWVEVAGERLDHFYETQAIAQTIDLAQVGTMEWPNGE